MDSYPITASSVFSLDAPYCYIRQVIQVLHQIDLKHQFQVIGLVPALSLVVVRLYHPYPFAPRYDSINLSKNFFFFVKACASSSVNIDNVICFLWFYYIRYFFVMSAFVRCCLNGWMMIDVVQYCYVTKFMKSRMGTSDKNKI